MNRKLSSEARLNIYTRKDIIIGTCTLIFGVFVCTLGFNTKDIFYKLLLDGEGLIEIEGEIISVWAYDWDDYGSTAYGYEFYFIHADLGEIRNSSFGEHRKPKYKKEERVEIIYNADYPYANKIKQLQYSKKGYGAIWYLFIPILGVIVLIYGRSRAKEKINILENGGVALGNLIRTEGGFLENAENPDFVLIYEYLDEGKKYEGRYSTKEPEEFADKEVLFYRRKHHWKILIYKDLPPAVRACVDGWMDINKFK